ncbi:MAG: mechanosensitive ion channel family protein [Deferribacterales bacterium]
MDISQSIYLLFDNIIKVSVFVLKELVTSVENEPVTFAFTVSMAVIGYLLINIYKFVVSRKNVSQRVDILVYILSPFIFILFTYYAVQADPRNPLYIILNYLGFFWLASVLMRVPSKYFGVKIKLVYLPALIFIALALTLSVYTDIAVIYSGSFMKEMKSVFDLASTLSKVLMSLGIFIYMKAVLPQSVKILMETYPRFVMFSTLARLLMVAYIFIAFMWIFNIIALDFRAVMAVALMGMMIAALSYTLHKIRGSLDKLFTKDIYTELEWIQIRKNTSRFVFVIFVYIYYILVYNALHMSDVLERLKLMYLFETKLFSLSVLSLISAVFIFIFLKSLLFLFTKYLRVLFEDKSLADDTDSLEIIVYNIGLLFVVMLTMLQVGITWQIVVPVAGALGIGIGFGLQTVINNYICGFILLFSKKIRIGDFVELPGSAGSVVGVQSNTVFGRVASIDMFATTVQTYDNIEIMVPNSVFISDTIINYTRSDKYIRVRVPVGIAYSSDIDLAQKLMREAIEDSEHVVKYKGNDVWFMGYGESSLDFMVLFWLNMSEGFQITAVKNIFLTSLWHKFKEHGIEILFPQQDVWFRNGLSINDKKTDSAE